MRDDLSEVIDLAVRVKAAMRRKNKVWAWTKCPRCGAKVHAFLLGRRGHLRMFCETDGCISVTE